MTGVKFLGFSSGRCFMLPWGSYLPSIVFRQETRISGVTPHLISLIGNLPRDVGRTVASGGRFKWEFTK